MCCLAEGVLVHTRVGLDECFLKQTQARSHVTKTSMADQMGVIVPVEEFKRIQEMLPAYVSNGYF